MLRQLPEEPELITRAFTFEKEHPDLFGGTSISEVGVYFSDETRDHTCFGTLAKGYYQDYSAALHAFFDAGISADTIFSFPEDAHQYAVIVVPSAVLMKDETVVAMRRYLAGGGQVIVSGPSCLPECKSNWKLPNHPELNSPEDFFDTTLHGVSHHFADWITKTTLAPSEEPCQWIEPTAGIHYNPHRMGDGQIRDSLIGLVRSYVTGAPIEILSSRGYLITMFETEESINVHFLAEDYDTDIDHELDEMRFHRSRVNYINKVEPIGIDRVITLRSRSQVEVYVPFHEDAAEVQRDGEIYSVTLPEKTAYAIMKFLKKV